MKVKIIISLYKYIGMSVSVVRLLDGRSVASFNTVLQAEKFCDDWNHTIMEYIND
jgi:hypothetical protein